MYTIVSHQRSGTHWLLSLLRSHPACFGVGEVLHNGETKYNYYSFLGRLAASDPEVLFPSGQIAGWNAFLASLPIPSGVHPVAILHYNQIEMLPNLLLLHILSTTGIVHLVRENILRSIVSDRVAAKRKALPPELAQPGAPVRVTLAAHALVPELTRRTEQIANWRELLGPVNPVEVTYEGLLADTAGECNRILAALDLPPQPLSSNRQRMTPQPLSDVLTNFDEVTDALRGTRFESMLDG